MDDFSPAKNLMTMCFTYYYIGKGTCSPGEALKRLLCVGKVLEGWPRWKRAQNPCRTPGAAVLSLLPARNISM